MQTGFCDRAPLFSRFNTCNPKGCTETQGRGFSAAKAIMLLKEERNAIKAAAEKAAALSEQRKKRHGGGRSGRGEI